MKELAANRIRVRNFANALEVFANRDLKSNQSQTRDLKPICQNVVFNAK